MPALYLFGKRTLLGGDDLHVPALITVTVRVVQLSLLVSPLGFFIWKQALVVVNDVRASNANANSSSSGIEWPVWRYLINWWGELETAASQTNDDYNGPPECIDSFFAKYYPLLSAVHLAFTVLFCFYSLFLESMIWHWSSQGTPTMRQPRTKKVQELLERKIGTCTVLLAFIVGGYYCVAAICFARPYTRCFGAMLDDFNSSNSNAGNDDGLADDDVADDGGLDTGQDVFWVGSHAWYALGALLATSQIAEVVVAALFYARLKRMETNTTTPSTGTDAISNQPPQVSSRFHPVNHELTEELWNDRCQSLFRCLSISTCFLFGGQDLIDNGQRNNAYKHVAQALADYLETRGTLDIVPTDIFTGLFVLQRIQRQRILQTRRSIFEESSSLMANGLNRVRDGSSSSSSSSSSHGMEGPENHPHEPIDSHYHPIASPDAEMGLRSRVTSSNALASSNVSLPLPPSQHLQQMQGLRQQHQHQQWQQSIFRRVTVSATDTDPLLPPTSSTGDGSFYRATARQVLNPCDMMDTSTLEEGARMCKYALSIYTWKLYVLDHPVTGFPRLVLPCGSEGTAEFCHTCCCQICGILNSSASCNNNNDNLASPMGASMPLHRHEQSTNNNGHYDTNMRQESLFSATGVTPSNPPPQDSNEGSEGHIYDNEADAGYNPCWEDQYPGSSCWSPETMGDTICDWHKRALLLVAGIPEADLVYAEFSNKFSSVPYCILLDHERALVVVSVRGSLSLEDIVTDTLVLPESLEDLGNRYGFDGRGQYCHAGVLACFENVLQDLQKHSWLERLLEQQYPEYSLRIVGHSLGAGVATLLGYVLRPKYPSLKVFGYSPPGCSMTWEMAIGCHNFVTTFVLDSDIVPRLSVLALEDLRDEVLKLIGRIKVPKHEVYQNFLRVNEIRGNRGCLIGRNSSADGEDYLDNLEDLTQAINESLDEVPSDTIYQRQLRDFLRVQEERKETRGETNSKSLPLYPPGKMIHLVRTGEEGGCSHVVNQCLTCCTSNSGFVYTPVYISNDDLDEIVVSATMGTDHFVNRMCDELRKLSENYCSESH